MAKQAKKLFDLHCDTLYEALRQNKRLGSNDLNISFERLRSYDSFTQVLAMWSDSRVDDDMAFRRFKAARELLEKELLDSPDVVLCTSDAELRAAETAKKNSVFLAVEGGKLLSDNLGRLDELYNDGVRFLTLVWDKICKLGGAHDTVEGLTDFGRKAVNRCFELGIIPDLSHASDKMISEVIEMAGSAGRICIATHSNSRAVCRHTRNLTDENFKAIVSLGGIVGISLAPMHLTENYRARCTVDDIIDHIEHYIALGGGNSVCLGCDLDGVAMLPEGISSVSDLSIIADRMNKRGLGDMIDRLFYSNARDFVSRTM